MAFETRGDFGARKSVTPPAGVFGSGSGEAAGGSQPWAVRELVLPKEAAVPEYPYQLIQCNMQFVKYLLFTAHVLPEEMMPEPMWSYQVEYYLAQVTNGGHGQYVASSQNLPWGLERTTQACRSGLKAMGLMDHLAIYDALLQLLSSDKDRAREFAERFRRRLVDPAADLLDERFHALTGKELIIAHNRDYLLRLPYLRLVPATEWKSEVARLADRNPRRAERAAAENRAKQERDARDPRLVTARALCEVAGRLFYGFTSINPSCKLDGAPMQGWFMATDKGPAVAFFFEREAVLCRHVESVPSLDQLTPQEAMHFLDKSAGTLNSLFDYTRVPDSIAVVPIQRPAT